MRGNATPSVHVELDRAAYEELGASGALKIPYKDWHYVYLTIEEFQATDELGKRGVE